MDGREPSKAVLREASDQAVLTGAALTAVMTRRLPAAACGAPLLSSEDLDLGPGTEHALGDDTAAGVHRSVSNGHPASALRAASHEAELLVIESRGPRRARRLDRDELVTLDRWWRAADHLAVGQTYLTGNPLVREPLLAEHINVTPAGPLRDGAGPQPDLVHGLIRVRDLSGVLVAGPAHGGPGPNAPRPRRRRCRTASSASPPSSIGPARVALRPERPGR